jgi:signal-transduction protein with cAMP-binding, CBS, and nucleotidyltransferase domain
MNSSSSDPAEFEDPLSDFEPVVYASELHRVLGEETVDAVQSKPWTQVSVSATIAEAVVLLHESKVSSLLVVDGEKLVGIFTERDVLEKVADQFSKLASHPVGEVMTSNPTVVYETDPVGTAVAAIAVAGHRHVPVLKMDGSLLGIVSPKRVLSFLNPHLD